LQLRMRSILGSGALLVVPKGGIYKSVSREAVPT
jgi:hypothetical protein